MHELACLCVCVCVCASVHVSWGALKSWGPRGVFGPRWLLRISQVGLCGTKSGRSREFRLSDNGEYFWLCEEGPYPMFKKAAFLLNSLSL